MPCIVVVPRNRRPKMPGSPGRRRNHVLDMGPSCLSFFCSRRCWDLMDTWQTGQRQVCPCKVRPAKVAGSLRNGETPGQYNASRRLVLPPPTGRWLRPTRIFRTLRAVSFSSTESETLLAVLPRHLPAHGSSKGNPVDLSQSYRNIYNDLQELTPCGLHHRRSRRG